MNSIETPLLHKIKAMKVRVGETGETYVTTYDVMSAQVNLHDRIAFM